MSRRGGFSLVEVLVALLIGLAVVAIAGELMVAMRSAEARTWNTARFGEQVFRAHGQLVRDLARLQYDTDQGPMTVSTSQLGFYALLHLGDTRFVEVTYTFDGGTGDLRRKAVGEDDLTFHFGKSGRARFQRVETDPRSGADAARDPGVYLAFDFSATAPDEAQERRFSLIGSLPLAVESSVKAFPWWNRPK